jgi:recombination protein RecA
MYGEGISKESCLLDLATNLNLIRKSGSWFSYGDDRIGQGRDRAKDFLKEHPDISEEIEKKVREFYLSEADTDAEKEE